MQKGAPIPSTVVRLIAAGITLVLIAAVATADQVARTILNTSVVYSVTLLPLLWTRSRIAIWSAAALAIALTFIIHFTDSSDSRVLFHRFLAMIAVVATAAMLHLLVRSFDRLDKGHGILVSQNQQLEGANRELAEREAEVGRQNEQLLSQTEELERQGEELRVTNDELAGREQMLEHLLALSRTLSAELTKSQVLDVICEALGSLMNSRSTAAAILERDRDDMVVICAHGKGSDSLVGTRIPLDRSFSQLILSRDQSGFLEDIALRPDLQIPQPSRGEPLKSVLSTPLRVRGRRIGCIEVYSHDRRTWTDAEVSLVESLAAQAAVSIEAAELFTEVDRERRRFASVFRTLPVGVIVTNADYTDVRANPAASAMLNLPVEINLGLPSVSRNWEIHHCGRPLPRTQTPLYRAMRHGDETNNEEFELLLANGRRLNLLVGASPLRDRDGHVVGAVCAFTDISAMKSLERELDRRRLEAEEAAVRKTRFLAAVSHDIRTPANAINLLAELIRHGAANPAMTGEVASMAGELRDSATALVNLVTDVLDLARYDTGRIELHESDFDLVAALREEARQILPLAQSKNLEVRFDPAIDALPVRADRIKLGRVITNLLSNAVKFTNSGSVSLDLTLPEDGRPRIEISDTGVGIDPEHLTRIFDEFFQLRNPARDATQGTGLGLTICKRLLDALGGQLSVQSHPGEGTSFLILLPSSIVLSTPFEQPPPHGINHAPIQSNNHDKPRLEGMRLLLVEDHPTTRAATARILRRQGALIAEAPDGASALRLLGGFTPHVILLDMMLPDMSGTDVLRAARASGALGAARVLVMTGDVTPERLNEVSTLGAEAFLTKPVDLNQLIDRISEQLIDEDSAPSGAL